MKSSPKYMLQTTVSDINGLHGIHDVKVDYHCFKGSPDDYKEYTEYPDCDVYHDAFDSAKERKQFMDENHPSEI